MLRLVICNSSLVLHDKEQGLAWLSTLKSAGKFVVLHGSTRDVLEDAKMIHLVDEIWENNLNFNINEAIQKAMNTYGCMEGNQVMIIDNEDVKHSLNPPTDITVAISTNDSEQSDQIDIKKPSLQALLEDIKQPSCTRVFLPVQGDRLRLGFFCKNDFDAVYDILCDVKVQYYLNTDGCSTITEAKRWLYNVLDSLEPIRSQYDIAILLNDIVIGSLTFRMNDKESKEATFEYALSALYWNKGYATEACTLGLKWIKENLSTHIRSLIALVVDQNEGSKKIMKKKKFKHCGKEIYTLNGNERIIHVYRMNLLSSCTKEKVQKTKKISKLRWKLLKNRLLKKGRGDASSASVHRHEGFKFFPCQSLNIIPTEWKNKDNSNEFEYVEYRDMKNQLYKIKLRKTQNTILQDVHVAQEANIDNTGNVCVWPSEEVLALYCINHLNITSDTRICEFGSGMTGLASLLIAGNTDIGHITVTDGNPLSVDILKENVLINNNILNYKVQAKLLKWDRNRIDYNEYNNNKYDYIIIADCLFFQDYHVDLIAACHNILKKDGQVIIIGPKRGDSICNFIKQLNNTSSSSPSSSCVYFKVSMNENNYDDDIWKKHQEYINNNKNDNDNYSPDIHYPILLKLSRV